MKNRKTWNRESARVYVTPEKFRSSIRANGRGVSTWLDAARLGRIIDLKQSLFACTSSNGWFPRLQSAVIEVPTARTQFGYSGFANKRYIVGQKPRLSKDLEEFPYSKRAGKLTSPLICRANHRTRVYPVYARLRLREKVEGRRNNMRKSVRRDRRAVV